MTSMNTPLIFVISLARAKDRRAAMIERLNGLGAPYEIVDAVDGEAAAPALYESRLRRDIFRRKYGRNMTLGEIGCYLSHYNLWRRVANENIPCALILEDDSEWDDDLLSVAVAVENLQWRWGVVLLSGKRHKIRGRELATVGDRNRRLVLCDRRMGSAIGYMVSQWGAGLLAEYCRKITAPVDYAYGEWWRSKIPFYVVAPGPVRHIDMGTTIMVRGARAASPLERFSASLWRKYDRQHCIWRYLQTSARKERGEL